MNSCLVVDASQENRKVDRRILETLKFTVSEAEDGQDALVAFRQSPPDVVLLDWNMPVMSGMDFLRAISADPDGRRPKIVFCPTDNDMAHIRAAIDAGADEYNMKPFDRDLLETKLSPLGLASSPRGKWSWQWHIWGPGGPVPTPLP